MNDNERLIKANIELQDQNKNLIDDIKYLVRFIQNKHYKIDDDLIQNIIDNFTKSIYYRRSDK